MDTGHLALAGRILLLGLERIVVKRLGEQRGSEEATLLFFGLGAVFLIPFAPGVAAHVSQLPGMLAVGAVYAAGFVLYVRALSRGQVSLVAPLGSFNVVFLAALATLFADEAPGWVRAAGLVLILLGTALLEGGRNLAAGWRSVWRQPGAAEMVASAFLVAAGRVVDKRLSPALPPLAYAWAVYTAVSAVLAAYLLARGRLALAGHLLAERPSPAVAAGLINAYAYALLLAAFRTMDASVAEPASNLSMLVAILLGGWLYGEPVRRRLPAAAVMLAGTWLLLRG